MMVSVETCLRSLERRLRRWLRDPGVMGALRVLALGAGGFFLSAASLRSSAQPLVMGLCWAFPGWRGGVAALGGILGYPFFWGRAGLQGVVWTLLGLGTSRLPGTERPGLGSALGAFLVSAAGLAFQLFLEDSTPFPLYLLRICLGAAGCAFFSHVIRHPGAIGKWVAGGVGVLALSGAVPIPGLNLGCAAAGCLAVSGAFPAAALAGLGLDLSRVTAVPMGPVLCISYFARLLPPGSKWIRYGAPGAAALAVMALCGVWDPAILPGLILGGLLGLLLPPQPELRHRRGETGLAQVRLEVTAGILAQTQQLLLEIPEMTIDEEALVQKAMDRACSGCFARNACPDRQRLAAGHLHQPDTFQCRKPGRIRMELRRSQDQLKAMKAQRQRQSQCRFALIQQYRLLSEYLRELADRLPRRGEGIPVRFRVRVCARSIAREKANGDRCLAFSGGGCRYYVLLCDGMGTGLGAAEEAGEACRLLKQMLTAGWRPEQAFRCLNSLLVLRDRAGAVTLDLAEIRLDSGRVNLYKWGAAPSYILGKKGMEKAGTAMPPPGLSMTESKETVIRLSLRRGESLILVSDGAEPGEALGREVPDLPPGVLAERILKAASGEDDATVVVIRLYPGSSGG